MRGAQPQRQGQSPQPPPPPPHSQQYQQRQHRQLVQPTPARLPHSPSMDTHYVNPKPNISLINPDHQTVEHMKRLGLEPNRQLTPTIDDHSEPRFCIPYQYNTTASET